MDATPPPAAEPHPQSEPLPLPPPVADAPLPLPADASAPEEVFPPIRFTLRRLCHILVLLFCLLLVIRTTFVEPFGVTTGSMAQTVLGNRREKPCPNCSHPVCVGTPEEYGDYDPQNGVTCPNCGFGPLDLRNEDETFGDRLLVDKLTLRLRPPHRWEVAVFRCPDPKERRKLIDQFTPLDARLPIYEDRVPCENRTYVKRVVGLPGERVRIWDGDVYANGQLQRKDLPTLRELRVPVFRMDANPPKGWAERWEVGPPATPALPNVVPPKLPAVADVVQGTTLVLDATAAPFGVTYRNRRLGTQTDEIVTDGLGYNGRGTDFAADDKRKDPAVHDFMVECEVEVVSGDKGAFAVRLGDGADTVSVHLPIHADATGGTAQLAHDRGGSERPFDAPFALVPGKKYTLEFAFVDRRVFIAIDGKATAAPLDLPPMPPAKTGTDPAGRRGGTDRPVQLGCRGGHVVVRHFTIWRDIHYRDGSSKHAVKSECQLGADEYFMLGDNSANSGDSREWAAPGVPERDFLGKPFLLHQPLRRANPPLFGLRQVIDWERFRLLR